MRLSPPSFVIFLISLACAAFAVLPRFGVSVIALPIESFWLLAIAWLLLTMGVLFRGM